MKKAVEIINELHLEKHIEGGYFAEIARTSEYSKIYYLLQAGCISKYHRLPKNELLSFSEGAPLIISVFDEGFLQEQRVTLGRDRSKNERRFYEVEKNNWFGFVATGDCAHDEYSLIECIVRPPFSYDDLEMSAEEKNDHLKRLIG